MGVGQTGVGEQVPILLSNLRTSTVLFSFVLFVFLLVHLLVYCGCATIN